MDDFHVGQICDVTNHNAKEVRGVVRITAITDGVLSTTPLTPDEGREYLLYEPGDVKVQPEDLIWNDASKPAPLLSWQVSQEAMDSLNKGLDRA